MRRLSTVDLADHLAEARAVIEEARARAEVIIAEAEARSRERTEASAEAGRQAGYRDGRATGETEGRTAAFDRAMEQFREQHSSVVAALQSAMESLAAQKRDLLIQAEHDVLELALAIARKLTFAVGEARREAAVGNLREALRIIGTRSNVTVCASPRDVETLKTFAATIAEFERCESVIRIVPEPSVAAGGCRVATDRTEVDATLETQLDAIVSALTGATAEHA